MNNYVYLRSEPNLFTVGFYAPNGTWNPDTDYNTKEEAALRVAFLNGCPVFNSWTPTAKNINALPYPIRNYIAGLETNADPPSMVRENVLLRDTIKAMEKKSTVTREWIEDLKDLLFDLEHSHEDPVERSERSTDEVWMEIEKMLESKGFTVRKV